MKEQNPDEPENSSTDGNTTAVCFNYEFVQEKGDIYISFPDIITWITK